MSNFKNVNKEIENAVVGGYKKIEDGVVSGYKKIEEGAVSGYKKIEDKFIAGFLANENETTDEARARIKQERAERGNKRNQK